MRLEDAGHVLDAQHVDVEGDELVNEIQVVLQVVLLLGVLMRSS